MKKQRRSGAESVAQACQEISEGQSQKHPELEGSCFHENLDTALKEVKSKDCLQAAKCVTCGLPVQDGLKYAVLCRVLCGVPGDDPTDTDKDCIILEAGRR